MNTLPFLPTEEKSWIENNRRRELIRCVRSLRKLAENTQITEDYVTETPAILAKLIAKIAEILEDEIPSGIPAEELEAVNAFVAFITSHLRYVERARVTQIPWSIVQPAEKLFQRVTDPNSLFIIRPTWSYNYSLTGEFWASYSSYLSNCAWFPLGKLLGELCSETGFSKDQKIYCLSFPRVERLNCLLHANWGHEIGHILAKNWIDTRFADGWTKAESQIKNSIEEIVKKSPPPVDPVFKDMAIKQIVAQEVKATMKMAQQGLVELLCDRIGVHIFGPSALASAMEFAALFALDISPLQAGNYPPWRYRIRKMTEFCDLDIQDKQTAIGYPNATLKPFVDWLSIGKKLAASTSDYDALKQSIVTTEAYNFIENQWADACAAVIDTLPPELSEPYYLHGRYVVVSDLVSRISDGIPPNESTSNRGRPASLADILCSAWAYTIMRSTSDPKWGDDDDYSSLNRLILKACESSYVVSELGERIEKMAS